MADKYDCFGMMIPDNVPAETFAQGMARASRGMKSYVNDPPATPPFSEEVKNRVNSDLDRAIEHWDNQDKVTTGYTEYLTQSGAGSITATFTDNTTYTSVVGSYIYINTIDWAED